MQTKASVVAAAACLWFACVGHADEPRAGTFGLPGWKEDGKNRILGIAVVKQDMTISFREAVRYFTDAPGIERVAAAFAEFERVPFPHTDYDDEGRLIQPAGGLDKLSSPRYHLVVRQVGGARPLYLTLERGPPPAAAAIDPATGERATAEAPAVPAPAPATPPEAPEKAANKAPAETKGITATLWAMHATTMFFPYCVKYYPALGPKDVPDVIRTLDAFYEAK